MLLTEVIYLLSLHPEVTQRLRREIESVIPTERPTYEDIRRLPYRTSILIGKAPMLTVVVVPSQCVLS